MTKGTEPIKEWIKTCPNCGAEAYVVSIFGSICGNCFYNPSDVTKGGEE